MNLDDNIRMMQPEDRIKACISRCSHMTSLGAPTTSDNNVDITVQVFQGTRECVIICIARKNIVVLVTYTLGIGLKLLVCVVILRIAVLVGMAHCARIALRL